MTNHGNVPKWTEENYPIWKQKIRRVLIPKKAYNIITGVQLLCVGNGVALHLRQDSRHDRANHAQPKIHLGCCKELSPHIDDIDDSVDMWEAHRYRPDNASTKLSRNKILRKFTASQLLPDKTITQYITKLIAFCEKLTGTTKNITDHAAKTHIFTTLSNSYETTIQILQEQIPAPTALQCMDAICKFGEGTTQTKEIGDACTGAALYSHGGNCSHGCGRGGRGG